MNVGAPHRATGDPNVIFPPPFEILVHGGKAGDQGGVAVLSRLRPPRSAAIAVTIAIDLDCRIRSGSAMISVLATLNGYAAH